AQHSTIFDDKWVLKILERELLEIPAADREPVGAVGRPNITFVEAGKIYSWPIEVVSVVPDGVTKSPNDQVSISVVVQFQDDVRDLKTNSYRPKVRLVTDNETTDLPVNEESTPEDVQRGQLSFNASGNVGSK